VNIFEFALDFERENKNFYRDQSQKSENESLKKVFNYLADEEEKHEQIVKKLSEDKKVEQIESDILPKAKEAFEKIAVNSSNEVVPTGQVDIYKKAKEMETKSYNFYQSKAKETDLMFVQDAFEKLAKEEKKHETILRNLVELVNRPNTWLDDAEWYHLEDY
jgi:rubrerythrin